MTDAGLVHLKGLPQLRGLSLNATEVTDAVLAELSGMKSLVNLYLYRTKVSDTGLPHLRGYRNSNPSTSVKPRSPTTESRHSAKRYRAIGPPLTTARSARAVNGYRRRIRPSRSKWTKNNAKLLFAESMSRFSWVKSRMGEWVMRLPHRRLRLSVKAMLGLVAVVAILTWGGVTSSRLYRAAQQYRHRAENHDMYYTASSTASGGL